MPNSFVSRIVCLAWGLISPSDDLYGEAQVYERVRISLVEINETVGRFVISVRKRPERAERCIMP